ncbi:MAG: hypothetical protein ABIM99_04240 [Candidatus Dojkabacteria bacterium]
MEEEKKVSIPLVIGGVAIVVVVAAGGIFISLNQNQSANIATGRQLESITNNSNTTSNNTANMMGDSPTMMSNSYKDGTYTSSGSYVSPAGNESVDVSITVANDTVTGVTVTPKATDSESQRYQSKFAFGISSLVVGKKISALNVSKVNGSSLTSTGFNAALAKIRTQAQS